MTNIPANLSALLQQSKGDGLLVSAYIDGASIAGGRTVWPGPVKAKVTAVESMLRDDERALGQFKKNLEAIGRVIDAPKMRHAPGIAVFAAKQRGFLESFALETRPENELVVHESPYLVPLLMAQLRQREFLVVLANSHRARLYAATLGTARLLGELEGDVPRKQHSCGERWGKEQATIAQRRDDCIHRFRKELAEMIDRTWAEHAFQGIFLLGEHENLENLKKEFSPRSASHVRGEMPVEWVDDVDKIARAAHEVISEHARREEQDVLHIVEERLRESYAIAAGPRAALEAIETGGIGPRGHGYLVVGPDSREAVARCQSCRALSLDMPTICPRCGAACVEGNLWEEMLLLALRHDIAVRCVGASASLAAQGGMVAVLAEARPALRQPVAAAP